mmetsp:Transcript_6579/g.18346  ORF Transcript_6579/g.18346 Transcript_6579/m.18346 type:complete len:230 (+) Transcript_6579:583-1272(+)
MEGDALEDRRQIIAVADNQLVGNDLSLGRPAGRGHLVLDHSRRLWLHRLILKEAFDGVHVDLELGSLADEPGHQAREVERRGERQTSEATVGGQKHGHTHGSPKGNGDANELEADAEPTVGHLDRPPAAVGGVQQSLVLVVEEALFAEGTDSCEAGEGLLEVGEDGAEGDAVEALELAAGGDENVLQAPVNEADGDGADDEHGCHGDDHSQRHPDVDKARAKGVDAGRQ